MSAERYFPWNGSKRWLLPQIEALLRQWDGGGRFIEPCVGGGSVSRLARALFPAAPQLVGDANPWLAGVYAQQILGSPTIPGNFHDVKFWRSLKDSDLAALPLEQIAVRFAVCLLTAWGNRWECHDDGEFRSTVNQKYCQEEFLRRKLTDFFSVKWLTTTDEVCCADVLATLARARPGDLIYIDPPYPESLGYGNNKWGFEHLLDMVDMLADMRHVNVIISNMSSVSRLFERIGFSCQIVAGPSSSKTRAPRTEVLGWRPAQ